MDLVDNPEVKDKIFTLDGHQVAIDRKSYLFLNGTEIDFQTSMVKTGRSLITLWLSHPAPVVILHL